MQDRELAIDEPCPSVLIKKRRISLLKKILFLKKILKKVFAPVFIKNYKSTNSKFFFSSFLKKKNQEIYFKLKNFEISIIGSPSKNGKKAKPRRNSLKLS